MREIYKTNIERAMKGELEKQNIEFVEQYPIRCKYGYIVDFFLPKYNLIVECDGEVWHKEGNSHDRKRDFYLKKRGFIILRFKGKEILNDIKECVNVIQSKGGEIQNGES